MEQIKWEQIKLDKILTKKYLSYIEGFFIGAIEAINLEWVFRKYFDIKISTINEGSFKEVSIVIQIYNSQNPNKGNIAEVRFSRNSIPLRNYPRNYFDLTLCVELDLTEANIAERDKEDFTKRVHKSYFTFEELALLDSAVAVAADKIAEEDYSDEEYVEMFDELDEMGEGAEYAYQYESMMEIIGLKNGVIDRNALSEINLYSIISLVVRSVAPLVGCPFFNKLTIYHAYSKFHVRLEECVRMENCLPCEVSSHKGFKLVNDGVRLVDFQLTVVEDNRSFTANQLTLLDNAAKLILSELTKMDRIKYLMDKLDSDRWGAFFVNSQKLFMQDVVDYWKEVADADRDKLALALYCWENCKLKDNRPTDKWEDRTFKAMPRSI